MTKNFWQKLKRPFFCLAPMADVTDAAFRFLFAKYSKTKANRGQVVLWTEFVSADGLCHKTGRKKLAHILRFSPREKPLVAQVFGANPVTMEKACRLIAKLGPSKGRAGFDGIDLNLGCPDKSVVKQGAGSALIKNPALARALIRAAIKGAGGLPISVKTRVGFNHEEIDTWIPELLKEDIQALTIHARTKKEMSQVPANWDYVKRVVAIVRQSGKNIPVIGNGDVLSLTDGRQKCLQTGCDGVMVGRAVFGNPWFFSETPIQPPRLADSAPRLNQGGDLKEVLRTHHLEESQWILLKIKTLVEHIKLFDRLLLKTGDKSYAVMKKHFKAYITDFAGAKELRGELMLTDTPQASLAILAAFQKSLK